MSKHYLHPLRSILLLSLLSLSLAPVHAQGNPDVGKQKASTCMGCHGINGYNNVYPTYHVPRLAGQHPEYIIAALKEYRAGERKHGTMHAQASSLSDEDMADIAAFFASGNQ
jgi:cytochrome c553